MHAVCSHRSEVKEALQKIIDSSGRPAVAGDSVLGNRLNHELIPSVAVYSRCALSKSARKQAKLCKESM